MWRRNETCFRCKWTKLLRISGQHYRVRPRIADGVLIDLGYDISILLDHIQKQELQSMLNHAVLQKHSHVSIVGNLNEAEYTGATSVSNEKIEQIDVDINILKYLLEYLNEESMMNT